MAKSPLKFKRLRLEKSVNCVDKLNLVIPHKLTGPLNEPDLIAEILAPESILIPQEKVIVKPNEEKRFFKASFKKYLDKQVNTETIIGIIENFDLSRKAQGGTNFDLETNKNIALSIMESTLRKEVRLTDLTRYNRLINAINSKDWYRDNSVEQMQNSEKIRKARELWMKNDFEGELAEYFSEE